MSEPFTFDAAAYIAQMQAAGQTREIQSGEGAIVPLAPQTVEPWRALLVFSRDQRQTIPVPAQLIPPELAGKAPGNLATELARSLRAQFSHPEAEGGDGTVVWCSVLGPDEEKGRPMAIRVLDHVSTKSKAYARLLEAGRIDKSGKFTS